MPTHTADEWDRLRGIILQRYCYERMQLEPLVKYMEEKHRFRAPAHEYSGAFNRWGVKRYLPEEILAHICSWHREADNEDINRRVFFFAKEIDSVYALESLRKRNLDIEKLRQSCQADSSQFSSLMAIDIESPPDGRMDGTARGGWPSPSTQEMVAWNKLGVQAADHFTHQFYAERPLLLQSSLEPARFLGQILAGKPPVEENHPQPSFYQVFRDVPTKFKVDDALWPSANEFSNTNMATTSAICTKGALNLDFGHPGDNAETWKGARNFLRSFLDAFIRYVIGQYNLGHTRACAGFVEFKKMLNFRDEQILTAVSLLATIFHNMGQHTFAVQVLDTLTQISNNVEKAEKPVTGMISFMKAAIEWEHKVLKKYSPERIQQLQRHFVDKFHGKCQSALTAQWYVAFAYAYVGGEQKISAALNILEKLKVDCEEIFGECHIQTVSCLTMRARILSRLGHHSDAANVMKYVIKSLDKVFKVYHPIRLEAVSRWAIFMLNQGKFEEAEEAMHEVIRERAAMLGPYNIRTIVAINHLNKILQRQNKQDLLQQQVNEQCATVHATYSNDFWQAISMKQELRP